MVWQFTKSVFGATKETGKLLMNGVEQFGNSMSKINEEMFRYRYFDGELGDALYNLTQDVRSFYYVPTKWFDVYYKQYIHGVPTIYFNNERIGSTEIIFDFQVDGKDYFARITRHTYQTEYDSLMTSKGKYSSLLEAEAFLSSR